MQIAVVVVGFISGFVRQGTTGENEPITGCGLCVKQVFGVLATIGFIPKNILGMSSKTTAAKKADNAKCLEIKVIVLHIVSIAV
jgi:hypothetical protein